MPRQLQSTNHSMLFIIITKSMKTVLHQQQTYLKGKNIKEQDTYEQKKSPKKQYPFNLILFFDSPNSCTSI